MFPDDARRATGDSPYSTPNTLIVIIDDTRWCQQSILSPWLWTLYTSHDAISVLKIRTLEWDIVNKLNSKLQLLNICVKLVNIHWDAKYDLTPINININVSMSMTSWDDITFWLHKSAFVTINILSNHNCITMHAFKICKKVKGH